MDENNNLTDEQKDFNALIKKINENTGFPVYTADIIPSIIYQVYGINDTWFWDNEGLSYEFEPGTKSADDGEGGTTTVDIEPSTIEVKAYVPETEDSGEEGGDDSGEEEEETEEETYGNYEYNKYGKINAGKVVEVTITPSATLKEQFPYAVVDINGKEYDLAYLDNPLILSMDRNYRISINWLWNRKVEVFRIICNR